jgi:IS6 family transposase
MNVADPRPDLPVGAAVHSPVDRGSQAVLTHPGDRWFVDETSVKIAGRWVCRYRAIDQFG